MDKPLLGYRNYKPKLGKVEFYAEDLKHVPTLQRFLNEVDTTESDITPEGKKFLLDPQNQYLFDALEKAGGLVENDFVKKEDILKWLESVETNEMAKFLDWAKNKKN